jgi:hypothetical protein
LTAAGDCQRMHGGTAETNLSGAPGTGGALIGQAVYGALNR